MSNLLVLLDNMFPLPPCHCALCGEELPFPHSPDHLCNPCFDIVADYVVDHAAELLGVEVKNGKEADNQA